MMCYISKIGFIQYLLCKTSKSVVCGSRGEAYIPPSQIHKKKIGDTSQNKLSSLSQNVKTFRAVQSRHFILEAAVLTKQVKFARYCSNS